MATQNIENGAQLGAPNNGDTVNIHPGNTVLATNLDWSSVAAMSYLYMSKGFTGSLGSSASPFICKIGTLFEYSCSSGEVWWNSLGSGPDDVSAKLMMNGEGHIHFIDGVCTQVDLYSGSLTCGQNAVPTLLNIIGGYCTIENPAGTSPTTIVQLGGHLVLQRGFTTFTRVGGSSVIDTTDNLGTIYNYASGLVVKNAGATWTALHAWYIPDLSELVRDVTIGTTTYNKLRPDTAQLISNAKITNTSLSPLFGA